MALNISAQSTESISSSVSVIVNMPANNDYLKDDTSISYIQGVQPSEPKIKCGLDCIIYHAKTASVVGTVLMGLGGVVIAFAGFAQYDHITGLIGLGVLLTSICIGCGINYYNSND